MQDHVKLDVGLEILMEVIAKYNKKSIENPKDEVIKEKLNELMIVRDQIYAGDENALNKVISEFGGR